MKVNQVERVKKLDKENICRGGTEFRIDENRLRLRWLWENSVICIICNLVRKCQEFKCMSFYSEWVFSKDTLLLHALYVFQCFIFIINLCRRHNYFPILKTKIEEPRVNHFGWHSELVKEQVQLQDSLLEPLAQSLLRLTLRYCELSFWWNNRLPFVHNKDNCLCKCELGTFLCFPFWEDAPTTSAVPKPEK